MDIHNMYKLLHRAQNTYGYANQVAVATEELCELGAVLSKYVRYPDHEAASKSLREKIVEETSDVVIVLHHLYTMFNITPEEQDRIIDAKLKRLERWLDTNDNFVQTTIDREVEKG